jgi:glucuronosyltransferase
MGYNPSTISAHKNCKLFITHGGYLSQTESINYGVPMVGFPFFGDQSKNLKFAEYAGFGVELDIYNINEESVYAALTKGLQPS